ncbi:MAG TPA: cation-transporting P-type ATPase [Hyphomicrobiaceae bacterium]|nr:cation-transporting P-type ATPase [Hyphomicrobiaceae bacterium]
MRMQQRPTSAEPIALAETGNGPIVPAHPHAMDAAQVLDRLKVSPATGLDQQEVRARRTRFGPNVLETRPPKPGYVILLHQFKSSVVALLVAAAALSAAFGDWQEAIAILVVLLLNTAIGFFTELKAERSMDALRRIGDHKQRVRRDGATLMVDAEDLVPGDIVLLEAGDVASADARLVSAANLSVDESALTGESMPVEKSVAAVAEDAPVGDRSSMVHKGTALTRGCAVGVVTATGMRTELGLVARLAAEAPTQDSPLSRRLEGLSKALVAVTVAVAGTVVLLGILKGQSLLLMAEAGIALAVAAIPEGLPIVATLVLARGMWRMAEQNALIERLSAVETLGSTTVILTDKTGTLTENRMTVVRIVTTTGDAPAGREGDGSAGGPLRRLLRAAVLCNDAVLGEDGGRDSGDPMEVALLRAAGAVGLRRRAMLVEYPEVERHPFDSDTRMMATTHRCREEWLTAVKGAPEAVLAIATRLAGEECDTALDDAQKALWHRQVEALGRQGLRVIAVAERIAARSSREPYHDLTLLGLVGLHDPPRPDVPQAIAACRQAGIRVIMVTGDHGVTAASIARSIALTDGEPLVIDGRELARHRALPLSRLLGASVFARVSPKDKLDIVAAHQAAGEVVAMTGDGVNDAPALKQADIGIAMGQRGTEVARQAAAMVLRDDSFPTIVAAIREGRAIFANIRRFVLYLLACNLSEVMVVAIAVAAGLPLPLLPLQILFLNLVTDVFPAFAVAMAEGDEKVMSRPPRDPKESIVTGAHWAELALYGSVMMLTTLFAMTLARDWLALDATGVVTVSFLTLAMAQVWHVFNVVEARRSLFVNEVTRNPYVWMAIGLCISLLAFACYLPPLASVLRIRAPDAAGIGLVLAASLSAMVVGRLLAIILEHVTGTDDRPRQGGAAEALKT